MATVSRRAGDDLSAVLARSDVDAVVVCTENADHPKTVRLALEAGKHVAVEFPLAPDASTTRSLYALAASQGRVLHTELIGQLTGSFRALRTVADRAVGLEIAFEGGLYRWVAEEAAAGRHAVLATGRLHAAWSLAGPLTLESASLDADTDGYRLEVQARGRFPVVLIEDRRIGARRGSRMVLLGSDGPLRPEPLPSEPLFRADLDCFLGRIRGEREGYVSDRQVVEIAVFADAIQARCLGQTAGNP